MPHTEVHTEVKPESAPLSFKKPLPPMAQKRMIVEEQSLSNQQRLEILMKDSSDSNSNDQTKLGPPKTKTEVKATTK